METEQTNPNNDRYGRYNRDHAAQLEPILRELGIEEMDMVQYFACECGPWTYEEVAEMMRQLGERRTPETIKGLYQNHKQRVENWLDEYKIRICRNPRRN